MWPEKQEEKHGTFEERFPTLAQRIFGGSSKKVDARGRRRRDEGRSQRSCQTFSFGQEIFLFPFFPFSLRCGNQARYYSQNKKNSRYIYISFPCFFLFLFLLLSLFPFNGEAACVLMRPGKLVFGREQVPRATLKVWQPRKKSERREISKAKEGNQAKLP